MKFDDKFINSIKDKTQKLLYAIKQLEDNYPFFNKDIDKIGKQRKKKGEKQKSKELGSLKA